MKADNEYWRKIYLTYDQLNHHSRFDKTSECSFWNSIDDINDYTNKNNRINFKKMVEKLQLYLEYHHNLDLAEWTIKKYVNTIYTLKDVLLIDKNKTRKITKYEFIEYNSRYKIKDARSCKIDLIKTFSQ